jgi:hypothetical protein
MDFGMNWTRATDLLSLQLNFAGDVLQIWCGFIAIGKDIPWGMQTKAGARQFF